MDYWKHQRHVPLYRIFLTLMLPVTRWKHQEAIHVICVEFGRVLISSKLYSNNFCQLSKKPLLCIKTQTWWWILLFHILIYKYSFPVCQVSAALMHCFKILLFTFTSDRINLVPCGGSGDIWFVMWHFSDSSLKEVASTAYGQVCAPYHTWAVRTAVYTGMYTLPTRDQLFFKLNETGNLHFFNYVQWRAY